MDQQKKQNYKKKKLSAVKAFVFACLKSNAEELTEHEVGKLIDINNFGKVETAITSLMNEAIEEDADSADEASETEEKNE